VGSFNTNCMFGYLDKNSFTTIPNLSTFKQLQFLSISHNNISTLDIRWDVTPQLKFLNLSMNKLSTFPLNSLDNLTTLQTLDLSHNHLSNIVGLSSSFPALKYLYYMNHNKLENIDVVRNNEMPALHRLNAGYNMIERLIATVDKQRNQAFPNLHILELNNNNITIIDMYLTRFKAQIRYCHPIT